MVLICFVAARVELFSHSCFALYLVLYLELELARSHTRVVWPVGIILEYVFACLCLFVWLLGGAFLLRGVTIRQGERGADVRA